jgi:RNA polymerase sigma-70 factor, ECF subfamily
MDMIMDPSEKIWQEYHVRLRAFIKSKIADEAATDDTLQNVFLKMHAGLASLEDNTKLQSWLYQIARNTIIDYYRAHKPTIDIPEALTHPEPDPDEIIRRDLSDCLQPMIESLPEHYREAITFAELDGMTQKEVAQAQHISLSAAKSRIQRGRVLLKELLAECCQLEFDHGGRLSDYERKDKSCDKC